MAVVIDTADVTRTNLSERTEDERLWIYNALDCCVTFEIFERIYPQLESHKSVGTYNFARALQGPVMRIMARGIRVDADERRKLGFELRNRHAIVHNWLNRMCVEVMGDGVNYRSHVQLKELFYVRMALPKQYKIDKGEKKLSCGREALEKLEATSRFAVPIIKAIYRLRDLDKKIQVVDSGIDEDGRFRAAFNIGGTTTGRFSSRRNFFGRGTNFQNLTDEMRRIFISDEGRKLGNVDLEQAESRAVAYLAGDEAYIKACESADLHTAVARMVWPDLGWTGDPGADRRLADSPLYRHFSYRDLSKRGGHATNYLAKAWTIARHLKLSIEQAEEFQFLYFKAFPGIRRWHHDVIAEVQTTGELTTPFGRRRVFFGRRDDDSTLRKAIAYLPQSTIADYLNMSLLAIYHEFDLPNERAQLLGQVHDSIVFQFEEGDYEVLDKIQDMMEFPLLINGREMVVPTEMKVGYCWNKKSLASPNSPTELAQVRPTTVDMMDWVM